MDFFVFNYVSNLKDDNAIKTLKRDNFIDIIRQVG